MAWARRTDDTHGPIMAALRLCGWGVIDTSRMSGFCDLVAWKGDAAG